MNWRAATVSVLLTSTAAYCISAAGVVRFSEHLVSSDYSYAYGIWAADIDGDGDIDVTSADAREHNALYWLENDGKGNFRRHVIYRNANSGKTPKGTLAEENGRVERHVIADLNHDGHPDVVIVDNKFGDVRWFENDGTPKDDKPWTQHFISKGGLPGAYDVAVGDLNGDGLPDVVASGWRMGNNFVWFENPGAVSGQEWIKHTIDEGVAETRNVRLADFNGDGRLDLLGTGTRAGVVVWYENGGASKAWKKHIIDTTGRPAHGQAVDLDGDGDMDVVLAMGMAAHLIPSLAPVVHQVVWYENLGRPGDGTRWQKHVICERFEQGFEAAAADLDGDGDLDVIATGWRRPGRVAWFENPGDPKGKWTEHILKDDWKSANQIIAADLDGDGRTDIIAAADQGTNEVRWWRNEGRGGR